MMFKLLLCVLVAIFGFAAATNDDFYSLVDVEASFTSQVSNAVDLMVEAGDSQDVESFLDEMSGFSAEVEKTCTYTCPNKKAPKANGKSATTNGCGSAATNKILKLVNSALNKLPSSVISCCNTHDRAYSTCNSNRASADNTFKSCLANARNEMKKKPAKSRTAAEKIVVNLNMPSIMYTAVNLLGCKPFQNAQQSVCSC